MLNINFTKMKKSLNVFFACVLVSTIGFAQTDSLKQSLFSSKINKIGIVGSLYGQYAGLNSGFMPSGGGSLSLLFNEKIGMGFGGYEFYNPNLTVGDTKTRARVNGLIFEYILNSQKMVHFSFPLLLGVGSASTEIVSSTSKLYHDGHRGDYNGRGEYSSRGHFGVIQPGINLEVNVLRNVVLFGGANYRFALNSSSSTLSNKDLSGLGVQAGIKLGMFGLPVSKLTFKKEKLSSEM
jgi:hypothetical protein